MKALYWVPRHDDGSAAVTAAFLPALGYEISERERERCDFAREAASDLLGRRALKRRRSLAGLKMAGRT